MELRVSAPFTTPLRVSLLIATATGWETTNGDGDGGGGGFTVDATTNRFDSGENGFSGGDGGAGGGDTCRK
jgi:hypothetical protein